MRSTRWLCSAVLLASISVSSRSAAQEATSPINDLIARARSSLDNLKYADALDLGRQVLSFGSQLKRAQLMATYQVLASAFFPEGEVTMQHSDSAVFYLSQLVRLSPDAEVTRDLRWGGLDSLMAIARSRTFAVSVRPQREYVLIGVDGRGFVDVVTSQNAKVVMTAASRLTGRIVVVDSSVGSTRARLSMRAHDGTQAFFQTGDYVMRVSAVNASGTDSAFVILEASVEGVPPVLAPAPVFDSAALKPEVERSSRASAAFQGLFLAGATYALAQYARRDSLLTSKFSPDGRRIKVGIVIVAGSLMASILDKGRPVPQNVADNTVLRANFVRAVAANLQENREKVANFKVSMRFQGGDVQ